MPGAYVGATREVAVSTESEGWVNREGTAIFRVRPSRSPDAAGASPAGKARDVRAELAAALLSDLGQT
jgi:hypothetical protein